MKYWNFILGYFFFYIQHAGLFLSGLALTIDKGAWDKLGKDVQSLYVEKDGKYHLDVDGIENTDGLKSALGKERDKAKAEEKLRKELEKRFEGIDPDKVREMMDRFESDEDAKLIAKGQLDKVVEKRVEQMRKGFEKELTTAQEGTAKEKARADKFSQRVLDNHIRAAASKHGVHQHAVEDALFRARSMFRLNDDGDAIVADESGNVKMGKDGKTPFSPSEWLETMKESAPHWFPANNGGGGSQGDRGANHAGKKQVKRADFDKMNPSEQATTARDKNVVIVN